MRVSDCRYVRYENKISFIVIGWTNFFALVSLIGRDHLFLLSFVLPGPVNILFCTTMQSLSYF